MAAKARGSISRRPAVHDQHDRAATGPTPQEVTVIQAKSDRARVGWPGWDLVGVTG